MAGEIQHKVALPDGSFANTVGPADVIEEMYPMGLQDPTQVYIGDTKTGPVAGVRLTAVNSALRFEELGGELTAIKGGTVPRLCPVAEKCGSCVLAGSGLTMAEMSDRNCARANTTVAFEAAGVSPEGRFMMLPSPRKDVQTDRSFNDYYIVDDTRFTPEYNGDELMHNRLDAAFAVVVTKSWLEEKGITAAAFGMNGADGSTGVAMAKFNNSLDDETLLIPYCSLRQNMGDREEKDQILRGALNAYFDSKGYDEAARAQLLGSMEVSINFAASATLKYFAHKIQIPREGPEAPEGERKLAAQIRERYPDLIARANGKITSAIVLNHQYPGALGRGNIFPQFEAEIGIRETPITPDNCPGDGQTCHVAYREETEYALETQLIAMGVPGENILFDVQDVLDPASPDNNAASNRREQNGLEVDGVKIGVKDPLKTNRTLNAMVVQL